MKLYYSPGACSLAVHIALREIGANFDLEKVNLAVHETERGANYNRINPKGYVPALKLEDGDMLTEVGVILQYLADRKAEFGFAPRNGTIERYHLMEWLTFISSEIHKAFGPLSKPDMPQQTKAAAKAEIAHRFDYVEARLAAKSWLMGDHFTIADMYLFTIVNWTNFHDMDISKWPKLQEFMSRTGARSKVREAMKTEGLVQ